MLRNLANERTHVKPIRGDVIGRSTMDELRFASLLCSRLCHDLVGSIGAINNGLELLEGNQDKETQREAMELIQLRGLIQYLRVAFGLARCGTSTGPRTNPRTGVGLFESGKVELDWP